MDAAGKVIVAVPLLIHKACSTWKASGWVVGRRLVGHVGHAVAIELKLANWIVVCGKKLGEIPIDSWLQQP
jgi:hypothetical protein